MVISLRAPFRNFAASLRNFILVLALFGAHNAPAAWLHTHLPEGGTLSAFTEHHGSLYAVVTPNICGIVRWNGSTGAWQQLDTVKLFPAPRALCSASDILFAGTDLGLYASSDDGATWDKTSLPNIAVSTVIQTGAVLLAGGNGGIYRSTDNGTTWAFTSISPTPSPQINCIVATDSLLLSGTAYNGIIASTDGGARWTALRAKANFSEPVNALAAIGTTIFVGTQSGLWRGTISGDWRKAALGTRDSFVTEIKFVNGAVYACTTSGIALSQDQGNTWSVANTGFDAGEQTTVNDVISFNSTLFAATQYWGAYTAQLVPPQWNAARRGLTAVGVYALAFIGGELFAGTLGTGVYRSKDYGTSWSVANSAVAGTLVRAIAAPGTGVIQLAAQNGLYVSSDDGVHWTSVPVPGAHNFYSMLTVDATWLVGSSNGIVRSLNGGFTWTSVAPGIGSVTAFANAGGLLYAATQGMGVYTSMDGGGSWNADNTGLGDGTVNALTWDNSMVYAATNAGVYATPVGTAQWTARNGGMAGAQIWSLLVVDSILYAGALDGTVYRSKNHGVSWNSVFRDSTNLIITSMLAVNDNLLVGTYGNSIWTTPLAELTDVGEPLRAPGSAALISIAPNPARAHVEILFTGVNAAPANVDVVDALGRIVATIPDRGGALGTHRASINVSSLPTGAYWCRVAMRGGSSAPSRLTAQPFIVVH